MTDANDILIVDDEDLICFVLTHLLRVHGFSSRKASRGDEALRLYADRRPDLIIMDIRMPGMSGFDVLAKIRELDPHVPVILMTALSSVRDAVDSIKAGAFDYIAKPFNNDDMISTIRRALHAAAELRSSTDDRPEEEALPPEFSVMGASLAVRRLAREIRRLAADDVPVMITGEIGTGKRLAARLLHELSGRPGPFVDTDCTGCDETLLRRELYGSTTTGGFRGKFELAAGGTLLIDEAADIPWTFQDALAEDLHARSFLRPGFAEAQPLSARVLFSVGLAQGRAIDGNHLTRRFRDLYGDAILEVPPLRNRREDIPTLASQFLAEANEELQTRIEGIGEDALEKLLSYAWPGNVHQLKAVIRRATLTAKRTIGGDDIDLPLHRGADGDGDPARIAVTTAPLKDQLRRHVSAVERHLLLETLQRTGWNKARASRLLGVTYKTLLKKVSEYGIARQ